MKTSEQDAHRRRVRGNDRRIVGGFLPVLGFGRKKSRGGSSKK
jgi:hypothetical protein